ncbi:MAG: 16S rRNA (guanine(966)-N(2))-methyltransferase RsmD [Nakamurella sp.]
MTRIVAGMWGGRRLATPAGERTRPTSEKVRAALASSLTATGGLEGARVLDLYAGSGALGLELVSRGASSAVFVERDRAALVALRSNVETLGRSDPDAGLTVIPGEVTSFLAKAGYGSGSVGPFDVVVADPPYDMGSDLLVGMFIALHRSGMLAAHADLVVERSVKSGDRVWPEPLAGVRSRRYGDTLLCYGRAP